MSDHRAPLLPGAGDSPPPGGGGHSGTTPHGSGTNRPRHTFAGPGFYVWDGEAARARSWARELSSVTRGHRRGSHRS